ncbi:MAG TPA: TIGR00730 family Rossman fold protein [Anaerolineales bacterium]|nr:TIGR00730 family Rossman fold protein [Anaerolineales bacterium]
MKPNVLKSITVYCGSSDQIAEEYLEVAANLGRLLAERGITLVYGAGSTGMMGTVAKAVLAGGGEVIGVMPEIFDTPHLALRDISRYEVLPDMHTRLARMIDLADGFIALPGGYGTMDEFFQTVTWGQIGLHRKPIGLLNHKGYYNLLVEFIRHMETEGFMYTGHTSLYQVEEEAEALLAVMQGYRPPEGLAHWVDRDH